MENEGKKIQGWLKTKNGSQISQSKREKPQREKVLNLSFKQVSDKCLYQCHKFQDKCPH